MTAFFLKSTRNDDTISLRTGVHVCFQGSEFTIAKECMLKQAKESLKKEVLALEVICLSKIKEYKEKYHNACSEIKELEDTNCQLREELQKVKEQLKDASSVAHTEDATGAENVPSREKQEEDKAEQEEVPVQEKKGGEEESLDVSISQFKKMISGD